MGLHGDDEQLVAPELARVTPKDVAAIVKGPDAGKAKVVIDVRDAKEVAEGSIRGALNVPSSVFKSADTAELDSVIKEQLGGAQEVIVHCHFSKVRGPTCAKALNERLKALGIAGPEVKVLAGGVAGFMDEFKSDPSLVQLPAGGWHPSQQ